MGGLSAARVVGLAQLPAAVLVDERVQASVFITRRRAPTVVLNTAILGTAREAGARAWVAEVIAGGVLGFHARIV